MDRFIAVVVAVDAEVRFMLALDSNLTVWYWLYVFLCSLIFPKNVACCLLLGKLCYVT